MKATTVYRTNFMSRPVVPYPNAASRRHVLGKLLDILLVTASGAGIAAVLLFVLMVI